MAEIFEQGKRYRFRRSLLGGDRMPGWNWDKEINEEEVVVDGNGAGHCGIYGILPSWCEEIKEEN